MNADFSEKTCEEEGEETREEDNQTAKKRREKEKSGARTKTTEAQCLKEVETTPKKSMVARLPTELHSAMSSVAWYVGDQHGSRKLPV